MTSLRWALALIVAGIAWSCENGLGFAPPDEEDLTDTWFTPILDGDTPRQLEFTREDDANVFIRREVDSGLPGTTYVETERGTYRLAAEDDPNYPSIRFEPVGASPIEYFIIYFDPTTLDLATTPDAEYDPEWPSYRR